jgi:hypothetical protein
MDRPVAPAWIECVNDTLNGLVVVALFMASTTEMGLLYQRGNPARPQFRSFSLACSCGAGRQPPFRAPQRVHRKRREIVSSGVSMSNL